MWEKKKMHISKIETCSWSLSSFGLNAQTREWLFFARHLFVNGHNDVLIHSHRLAAILRTTTDQQPFIAFFRRFTWFSIAIRKSIYTQSPTTPKQRDERETEKMIKWTKWKFKSTCPMSINRNSNFFHFIFEKEKNSIYINICSAHSCNDKNSYYLRTDLCNAFICAYP